MNQNQLSESIKFIESKKKTKPEIGIILGSGLGNFADHLSDSVIIKCSEIPHYPISTVSGHAGLMIFGKLKGIDVLALKGRVHSYEGYSMQQVTYPVQIMAELGVKSLIVTNAAGGVNNNFIPGDLMLITDHVNLSFKNPLIGIEVKQEDERFIDMAYAYYPAYQELAKKVATQQNVKLQTGTLFMVQGPCYETAAEIRMIKILGGDAVTMSTVPEVIMANHKRMKVMGISCISNMATGISDKKLDHKEVTITANKIEHKFLNLITDIIKQMAAQ